MPYRDTAHALELVNRGQGSLVALRYGADEAALAAAALELAGSPGRVHVVSPDVAASHQATATSCRSPYTADPGAPAVVRNSAAHER
jgi:hypothetical protein